MRAAFYAFAPEIGTLTTNFFYDIATIGGKYSMFVLAGLGPNHSSEWPMWAPDIYGSTRAVNDPGTRSGRLMKRIPSFRRGTSIAGHLPTTTTTSRSAR